MMNFMQSRCVMFGFVFMWGDFVIMGKSMFVVDSSG